MIYFTSDTHFWHKNIIRPDYSNRPYNSIEEMNESFIDNWNKTVSNTDTIYHLGDVSFGNRESTGAILKRLNGKKILIKGNHDKVSRLKDYFDEIHNVLFLGEFFLKHIPDFSCYPLIQLCGHVHTEWKINKTWGFKINVGVDVWNYTPVSIDQIKELL